MTPIEICQKIAATINAEYPKYAAECREQQLHINGHIFHVDISPIKKSGAGWRWEDSGRRLVAVGEFRHKKRFYVSLDGDAKWAEIVVAIMQEFAVHEARRTYEAQRRQNEDSGLLEAFARRNNISRYGPLDFKASADPAQPFRIQVRWSETCTAERAQQIADALKSLGVI